MVSTKIISPFYGQDGQLHEEVGADYEATPSEFVKLEKAGCLRINSEREAEKETLGQATRVGVTSEQKKKGKK